MRTDIAAFNLLQGALQASQLRQEVYANNIANANTPGYKRQDVVFEDLLQSQMQTAPTGQLGVQHMDIPQPGSTSSVMSASQVQPEIVQDNSSSIDNNGNNVDINNEMTLLAENQIEFNALNQDLELRFTRTQQAIGG